MKDPVRKYEVIVIGGSAGSIPFVKKLLEALPGDFTLPIIICLHRLTDKRNGLVETLQTGVKIKVSEPDDKTVIEGGNIYVAPANYHLLIEATKSFALSIDEKINFSRPSIDLTFESAGIAYGERMIGIIYSGANLDGAKGMHKAHLNGATTWIQDPEEATVRTMPEQVLKLYRPDEILHSNQINSLITRLI